MRNEECGMRRGRTFSDVPQENLSFVTTLGGGTKVVAGAIVPSALSGLGVRDSVLHEGFHQNAQHPRRERCVSNSSEGAIKGGESFAGVWGHFFKSAPAKKQIPSQKFPQGKPLIYPHINGAKMRQMSCRSLTKKLVLQSFSVMRRH